jgi:hypothetical protein
MKRAWMRKVGRTPGSAADALVGLCGREREAGQGAGCRPGGLPHHTAAIFRQAWMVFILAATIWAASTEKPRFHRAALTAMEQSFDQRLMRLADDPYLLTGNTRGIYIEGFGAVFTAEVSLANGASPNPFRPTITKEDIARIHAKKLERLPLLRQCIRDTLLAAAASLDETPETEQIVVGVSLIYYPGEDKTGLPGQILMQGAKGQLVDAHLGRVGLETAVKVREF